MNLVSTARRRFGNSYFAILTALFVSLSLPARAGKEESASIYARRPILLALAAAEITHALLHTHVLFGKSIENMSNTERIAYFSIDSATCLLSYRYTKKYSLLVLTHALIHLAAVSHLILPWSSFFQSVFDMAKQEYASQSWATIAAYMIGTGEDVLTHALNAKALIDMAR